MKLATKAKAVEVPEDSSYITEGETYDITPWDRTLFWVTDDEGDTIASCFDGLCGHGISWERVYD